METLPDPFDQQVSTGKVISQLQEIFTICPVDKTTHNLALACKHYYQYVESSLLDSKACTDVTDKTIEHILKQHEKWNSKYGYEHVNTLPYCYIIPKLSKLPKLCWRFLAEVSDPNPNKNRPEPTNINI